MLLNTDPGVRRRLELAALLTLWLATWCLAHGYVGIRHDAVLYTLQALAHSSTGGLRDDVFLRFGSQDRYTIFSWIYAGFIHAFGVEAAARILTFTCQLAVLLGAALLLYRIVSSRIR